MTDADETAPRRCRVTRRYFTEHLAETLPPWRRRLVARHLDRCEECQSLLDRQRAVAADLQRLADGASAVDETVTQEPPDGLLDALLDRAAQPDLRAKAAAPMRGAVSGARPTLRWALIAVALGVGVAAGYATWRAGRWLLRSTTPAVTRRPVGPSAP